VNKREFEVRSFAESGRLGGAGAFKTRPSPGGTGGGQTKKTLRQGSRCRLETSTLSEDGATQKSVRKLGKALLRTGTVSRPSRNGVSNLKRNALEATKDSQN
jgi:hypothetical protein